MSNELFEKLSVIKKLVDESLSILSSEIGIAGKKSKVKVVKKH